MQVYELKDEEGTLSFLPTIGRAKKEQKWWSEEGIETTINPVKVDTQADVCKVLNNYLAHPLRKGFLQE